MRTRAFSCLLPMCGLLLLLGSAILSTAARADDDDGGRQSLDQILPEIRSHHPGTFYDAEGPWPGSDGRMHYRLKWMTPEGRIVWFDADARTGRVLTPDHGSRDFDGGERPLPRPDERRFRDSDGDHVFGADRWGDGPRGAGDWDRGGRNGSNGHDWDRGRDWGGRDWGGHDWDRGRGGNGWSGGQEHHGH